MGKEAPIEPKEGKPGVLASAASAKAGGPPKRKVIDTHIHLMDGIGGKGPRLNNMFFQYMCKDKKEGEGFNQYWDEKNYRSCWADSKCEVE